MSAAETLGLNNDLLDWNAIEHRKRVQRPDRHALRALLHRSNGAQSEAGCDSRINLLDAKSESTATQNLADRLFESEVGRLLNIRHASIFELTLSTIRHYSAYMNGHNSACSYFDRPGQIGARLRRIHRFIARVD